MSEIAGILKQFEYYEGLGRATLHRVDEDQLFWSPNEESNSLAIIVKHLSGNMKSRWTDFLTSDGEKGWRNRDGEFLLDMENRAEVMETWQQGWACLYQALTPLEDADLAKTIYIRNQAHSVREAIYRQLAHYPYHIGQMVYLSKMISRGKWASLSIAKGHSNTFNKVKAKSKDKGGHYTDGLLSQS